MKKFFSTALCLSLMLAFATTGYSQNLYVPGGSSAIAPTVTTVTDKVGIGINNPSEKLDVLGNINLNGANRTIGTATNSNLFIKTAGTNRVKFGNTGKTFFYGSVYLPQTVSLVLGLDNENDGVNSLKISYNTTLNHAFMNYKDNLIFRTGALTYSPLTMQGNGSIAVGYPLNYLNDGTQYQTQGYKFAVNGTALFEDKVTFKGNVGIGTNSPIQLFNVHGESGNPATSGNIQNGIAAFSNAQTYATLYIGNFTTTPWGIWLQASARHDLSSNHPISLNPNGGNVGIGTTNPTNTLDVNGHIAGNILSTHGGGDVVNGSYVHYYLNNYQSQNRWAFATANKETDGVDDKKGSDFYLFKFKENGAYDGHSLYINREKNYWSIPGNVGIGVNDPGNYKLAVNGKIIATEIVVKEFSSWPDFVFANSYNLRSLGEVENFINENGHLPEVPSAKVVKETGVGVGEMNAILLKKVEELTLYAIQQGKLIKALEEKLEKIEATK
jgi:hypothetical protein